MYPPYQSCAPDVTIFLGAIELFVSLRCARLTPWNATSLASFSGRWRLSVRGSGLWGVGKGVGWELIRSCDSGQCIGMRS